MTPYQPSSRFWLAVTLALCLAFGALCRFIEGQATEYARQEYEINAVIQQYNTLTFERDQAALLNGWLTGENARMQRELRWLRTPDRPNPRPD